MIYFVMVIRVCSICKKDRLVWFKWIVSPLPLTHR